MVERFKVHRVHGAGFGFRLRFTVQGFTVRSLCFWAAGQRLKILIGPERGTLNRTLNPNLEP
jgi:hypothetical protein